MKLEDHSANFRDEEGNAFLVRCPACNRENYTIAVSTGQCAWCGWKEEEEND